MFYEQLRAVLRNISPGDKILLLGDFNARVGRDCETWSVIGNHGLGNANDNGLLLLQLCAEFGLIVTNTLFQQNDIYKGTWMHPRSKHWHMIDYVIIRKRDRADVLLTRVCRSSECWTDHLLVRSKIRLHVKRKSRHGGVQVPKRIDVKQLGNEGVKAKYVEALNCLDGVKSWDEFKDVVQRVGKETLGFVNKKHEDWFDDNDTEIKTLLSEKRSVESILLGNNVSQQETQSCKIRLKTLKGSIQKRLRQIQNNWWNEKAGQVQTAADAGDTRRLHSLLNEVYGPRCSSISPLKSADGSKLIKDPQGILNRWKEHFDNLLNRESVVDFSFLDQLEQSEVKCVLDEAPTLEEVECAISKLKTGKSPGIDGIPPELLRYGGPVLYKALCAVIHDVWEIGEVPQDWRDAIMVVLYKGKGKRDECGNSRGIALLCIAGKVLSSILLKRLINHIADDILPESQCGFRQGRGANDMIFAARQLQEKCREQNVDMYQVFIDLTKAFDTVNRSALWAVLGKLGCPEKFVGILKSFHDDMKVWVCSSGDLSEPIQVENGVKQGDIPAPTLFAVYFAIVFMVAFKDKDVPSVFIRYRTSGQLVNLKRLKFKALITAIRDLLYADDVDFVSHTEQDMQIMLDFFSMACTKLGLTISLSKTKVLFQPAPGKTYVEPNLFVYGERLDVVDTFVYLGSKIHQTCSLDEEVIYRISRAAVSFGALEDRCWSKRGIHNNTKVKVYATCVLSSLLYALETAVLYKKHLIQLERFHQRCLRRILRISWESHVTNEEVLKRAGYSSIEAILVKSSLRWVGHVIRMPDSRIPKQLLYGELCIGKRKAKERPKLRYKDLVRTHIKKFDIPVDSWEELTLDKNKWRKLIHEGAIHFEKQRSEHEELKRAVRKREDHHLIAKTAAAVTCEICGRVCLSLSGFQAHMRGKCGRNCNEPGTSVQCDVCNKVCKNKSGLFLHMKVHRTKTK